MAKNIGVIQEQGYPAGQFGFDPIKDKEQKKIVEEALNSSQDHTKNTNK